MKIALSQRLIYHKGIAYDASEHGWYRLLMGHTLFFLPNTMQQDFDTIVDGIDLFILTGGDDSKLRRAVELRVATGMMQRNKPVLGVCHGAFLITDTLGGTVEEIKNHDGIDHYVMYHGEAIKVNSHHSLGITKEHPGAEVLCRADTGQVEAFIDDKLAGVVWHPERMETPWLPPEIIFMLGL